MNTLKNFDPDIAQAITQEHDRQMNQLELIASENFTSLNVMEAQGSILTNKYAEGYPSRRYYGGCLYVDAVETLAIERAKALFNVEFANVQPHSGSQANQAVFLALLQPGDTILGMDLACGGHLTHGAKVNLSGKWFNSVFYTVDPNTHRIDLNDVERMALTHRPKLIIAGGSAYPRVIDFSGFRAIADKIGAFLMVDMAHFAGLVAGDVYPSPIPHAHVITTTTHKTLRGPRGGMILTSNPDMATKINSAIFPGLQGGPLMHVIAGKAVALKECLTPEFKTYAQNVIKNAHALANQLIERGFQLITGGTDSHLILVNLQSQNLDGKRACDILEEVGITSNKNAIPFDPLPPLQTSGIRFGTPALTTRGFGEQEFILIANWIADILNAESKNSCTQGLKEEIGRSINHLCQKFPLYSETP